MAIDLERLPAELQSLLKWHGWPFPNPGDPAPPWIWNELGPAEKIGLARVALEMNKGVLEAQKSILDAQITAHNQALEIVGKAR